MSDRDEFYRQFSRSYDKLHQSEMQDDLVERVARAMWEADGAEFKDLWSDDLRCYEEQARAAIAVVLEEAAKIVDRNAEACTGNIMLHDILAGNAAAIRALIPKENK
jgi:hypothetical protein